MNYDLVAHHHALQAQQRMFDAVRLDGPVEPVRLRRAPIRAGVASILDRAAHAVAPRGHRLATGRQAAA